MQTRHHSDRKPRSFPNFHIRPLTAVHETGWFAGPWHSVRLLHQENDYTFKFHIPIATFWYQHSFGANTVPLWLKASKFTKFPYSTPYDGAWNRVICRTVTLSVFIALRKRLHFYVPHTHSYILISTFLWCKHGTILIESLEICQISVFGPLRRCMKPGDLPDRDAQCAYCTGNSTTFLGSPYP